MSEIDPFEGREPIAGLEHLGRAIVDEAGQPSGSPANYEATRGKGAYAPTEEDRAAAIATLQNDAGLAIEPAAVEAHPWAADAHD